MDLNNSQKGLSDFYSRLNPSLKVLPK